VIYQSSTLYQVAVHGHVVSSAGYARKVLNVFTYDIFQTARYLVPTKAQIATAFSGSVWAGIINLLSDQYVGETFFVWRVNQTGDVFTDSTIAVSAGLVAGARLPVNQAVYVGLPTGNRGIWYRGSKRMAPIPVAHVTKDELNATGQTIWTNDIGHFVATFHTGVGGTLVSFFPVVWSRRLSLSTPPPASQVVADTVTPYYDITLSSWRHRREPTQR
jgi:hypothetical protein